MDIGRLAALVTLGITAALGITVILQILNGAINMSGLLYGRRGDGRIFFSSGRVQLLVFTIWAAFSYLIEAMRSGASGRLPDIPPATLALLGGSHSMYLAGKAWAMLRGR